jgi:hypothetical protein
MTQQDVNAAELKLNATELSLDERLTTILGKMGKYYSKLAPTGRFDLNFDKVNFYKDETNDKILLLDGTALFKNCSIGKTKPISNIYALLDIDAQYKIGKGLANCQLLLDVQNVSVKNRPFENLKVPIIIDVNEQKIIVENFIGDFLGGKVTGAAEFQTDNEGRLTEYKINMTLSQVDTESFVSPQTRGTVESSGSINGELNIQGDFQKPQITKGRLIAQATGLKPRQTGALAQIRTAIYETIKKDLALDNIKIQAVIKGEILQISTFDIYGPTASLRGTGTYEPASDSVDIHLTAYSAAGKEEPGFIDSLTAGFGPAFLKVEMKGKLENPEIKVVPLPIIQQSLEMIGTK